MKQRSLGDTGFQPKRDKRTRKQIFLEVMDKAVPWRRKEKRIKPYYHKTRRGPGRPQMPLMLCCAFTSRSSGLALAIRP